MTTLSTHVLDAVTGTPAVGVTVTLSDTASAVLATAITDDDGRVKAVSGALTPGVYRLFFDTASYFASIDVAAFYPEVVIAFEVTDADAHCHVPLLLSPYAYSTYRGS
ncbi:hydroxyisourate hydrolase [Mycobacterium sp. 236(2023)]|uniref:hydroxyisourate hydrolase n=1 Tax=Mycobacterium sp. 236(2023) TaxID=3038163 RepID=UPI0024151C18|nr:hydroxyisourate hydrolase [Mycobacterium sp. 236(2023)]MDG4666526.1 hydroxyisourate hydrolase [Mycobacterium sp. 236(2023)]